jgi:hypothetical protein
MAAALASLPGAGPRPALPFSLVNRRGAPDHDGTFQRHHLLPLQLLGARCFGGMFAALGREGVGFDDFRRNGLLLPAAEAAVLRIGLPLHRGPHRRYNALVIERVGQIEAGWSAGQGRLPVTARSDALMRLGLLQRALRRRLLTPLRRRLMLHRHDPLGCGQDFTELDALADSLWPATELSS